MGNKKCRLATATKGMIIPCDLEFNYSAAKKFARTPCRGTRTVLGGLRTRFDLRRFDLGITRRSAVETQG